RLDFDGDKSCARHSPRGNHPHCSDAAAEVQRCLRRGTPGRAVPCGEDVVGGKAVPVPQLEQAEMAADGVECFVWFENAAEARRNRPGLSPTFEMRFGVHASIITASYGPKGTSARAALSTQGHRGAGTGACA